MNEVYINMLKAEAFVTRDGQQSQKEKEETYAANPEGTYQQREEIVKAIPLQQYKQQQILCLNGTDQDTINRQARSDQDTTNQQVNHQINK